MLIAKNLFSIHLAARTGCARALTPKHPPNAFSSQGNGSQSAFGVATPRSTVSWIDWAICIELHRKLHDPSCIYGPLMTVLDRSSQSCVVSREQTECWAFYSTFIKKIKLEFPMDFARHFLTHFFLARKNWILESNG